MSDAGTPGTPSGVAPVFAAAPSPAPFSARTSNTYGWPFVRSATVRSRLSPADCHGVSSGTPSPTA